MPLTFASLTVGALGLSATKLTADLAAMCLEDINSCIHVPACAQREVWRNVAEAVFKILDSTTIQDLVNRTPVRTKKDLKAVV